jgi:hypothetical protein
MRAEHRRRCVRVRRDRLLIPLDLSAFCAYLSGHRQGDGLLPDRGINQLDEELRSYLVAMEGRLMARLNNSEERILNRLASVERDFMNTKNFLVGDALVSGGRWLDLEARVTKLEDNKS